jgi:hypothetical protein
LVLSILCLIGNLLLVFYNIANHIPYWKNLLAAILMLAIAYSSYKMYKRQK